MRMNVRAFVIFCGSVQSMVLRESFRSFLGIDLNILKTWSFEKALLLLDSELWEDDLSSMLYLVKDYIVYIWELRRASLYDKNLSVPLSQYQNSSRERGMLGMVMI